MYTGTMHWETGEVSKDTHAALNVDDVVHIDADHPDGVIRVQHDAGDGVDILEAKDKASGVLSMRIDDAGVYRGDVVGASVQGTVVKYGVGAGTDLQTKVIALRQTSKRTRTRCLIRAPRSQRSKPRCRRGPTRRRTPVSTRS